MNAFTSLPEIYTIQSLFGLLGSCPQSKGSWADCVRDTDKFSGSHLLKIMTKTEWLTKVAKGFFLCTMPEMSKTETRFLQNIIRGCGRKKFSWPNGNKKVEKQKEDHQPKYKLKQLLMFE